MLERVRPALSTTGDEATVELLLGQVLTNGTDARRQRAALESRGRLSDVVTDAISITNAPETDLIQT